MHAIFVTAGLLYLVLAATTRKSRFLYYATYLFVVVNLTELIAYVWMRPFAGSGDTGRFNQGMMLSPWFLFGAGVLFTAIALGTIWRVVMPALDALFGHSVEKYRVVVLFTACVMFLWGSGLRVMWLYPDRQWKWGLSGVVASAVWVSVCLRRQWTPG